MPPRFRTPPGANPKAAAARAGPAPRDEFNRHRLSGLSRREREIVREILQGYSNGEIAGRLFISERTVSTHITRIFAKLGLENRLQLHALFKDKSFYESLDVLL
jgi:DNA-binding CsgD family transcriptional regulator